MKKFVLASLMSVFFSLPAFAEYLEYSENAYKLAVKNQERVVLDFHANWCPTCKAQAKSFENLADDQEVGSIKVFKVDFDNSDELKKIHGVDKQSTLVLIESGMEVDRSMGVSEEAQLKTFLKQGK